MELNSKVTALEDEVKILKSEVKTVLTEIRTKILASDNPFAPNSGGAIFTPLERPPSPVILQTNLGAGGETAVSQVEAAPASPPVTNAPMAGPPAVAGPAMATPTGNLAAMAPRPEDTTVMSTPEPTAMAEPEPEPDTTMPTPEPTAMAEPEPERDTAPAPAKPEPKPDTRPAPAESTIAAEDSDVPPGPEIRMSLMTIAALSAWAEEAASALGTQRLHIILDLAEFAGVLSTEIKDALFRLAKISKGKGGEGEGAAFNESLVVLRQLDAILHGESVDELSARRRTRRYGRIR